MSWPARPTRPSTAGSAGETLRQDKILLGSAAVMVVAGLLGLLIPHVAMGGLVTWLHNQYCPAAGTQALSALTGRPNISCEQANAWYGFSVFLRWVAVGAVLVLAHRVYRLKRPARQPQH